MIECQACTAPATLSLCGPCTRMLRTMLASLVDRGVVNTDAKGNPVRHPRHSPGWIELLADAIVGQTRLRVSRSAELGLTRHGGGGSRVRELDGEAAVTDHIAELPDDPDWEPWKAREERAKALRRQFLGAGGIDAHADELLGVLTNMLSTWIRDLCETHGRAFEPVRSMPVGFIGPLRADWRRLPAGYRPTAVDMAHWLHAHVSTIACHPAAGEFFDELRQRISAIEHLINRAPELRYCGPCPNVVVRESKRVLCHTELRAREGARKVRCPARDCRAEHDVEHLVNQMWIRHEDELMPFREIEQVYLRYGVADPPKLRTVQKWRKDGKLRVRGYLRTDRRRIGVARHSARDEPVYRFGDVRKLMIDKATRKASAT